MAYELGVFKRITLGYLALLLFNTFIIWFSDFQFYGFLTMLVSLWSVEQTFKINKRNNRPCTSWREFWSIWKALTGKVDAAKTVMTSNEIAKQRRANFRVIK